MATLSHIGIAVDDLSKMEKLFSLLSLKIDHKELVSEQGVITHFVPLPQTQSQIEFLEVTDPNGPVAKHIQKKGPGIHHLSFAVKKGELVPLCERLRVEGYTLTYDQPKSGAHGMMINFIHPKSAGGILIELMEPG